MKEISTYFVTPNEEDYGDEAVRVLERALIDMELIRDDRYFIFPTGAVSVITKEENLQDLLDSGYITKYRLDPGVEALDDATSQEFS